MNKDEFRKKMEEAITILSGINDAFLDDLSPVNKWRSISITRMRIDMENVRNALSDTWNIPWEEYFEILKNIAAEASNDD